MSKKSALTPATAPALFADSVSGPPAATAPFHSESDLTAGFARSTERIWWSYQPVESTVFKCRSVIPGPTGSVLSISASSSAARAADGASSASAAASVRVLFSTRATQVDRRRRLVTVA